MMPSTSELLDQSLICISNHLGDPTDRVFTEMYRRFPDLEAFKDDSGDWEHYMMQEILMNIMQFANEPDTALLTIKDMLAHHQLIGVSTELFQGMYQTLYDVLTPTFSGPNQAHMLALWDTTFASINQCIVNHKDVI